MSDIHSVDPIELSNPQTIRAVTPDEFLPALGQWTTVGGLVMLGSLTGALLLSAVIQYKVVVKAPAVVRPVGELRLVDAGVEGTIESINVKVNQSVEEGEVLATIDDSRLQSQKYQLLNTLNSAEQQLRQVQAQIVATDQQSVAEAQQQQRTVAAAQAELQLNQRAYQNSLIVTEADLQEAEAALTLAQEELNRYRQLADVGAVGELQAKEKEANVKVAQARLNKVEAALHPSDAQVKMARERVAQAQLVGDATLARFSQLRQELLRQHQQLEGQAKETQQQLTQLEQELENTKIRAPISGTILTLNLRNPNQVVSLGEDVAQIAPSTAEIAINALVSSQDIDKVAVEQIVQMRVSACPYPDFGTLSGVVDAVSPDAVVKTEADGSTTRASASPLGERRTYAVVIKPEQKSLHHRNRTCVIQAGMEGRADIISRQESVLRFVLRAARLLVD